MGIVNFGFVTNETSKSVDIGEDGLAVATAEAVGSFVFTDTFAEVTDDGASSNSSSVAADFDFLP